jgi:hypothetical protein
MAIITVKFYRKLKPKNICFGEVLTILRQITPTFAGAMKPHLSRFKSPDRVRGRPLLVMPDLIRHPGFLWMPAQSVSGGAGGPAFAGMTKLEMSE